MSKLKQPLLFLNFKAYAEATGKNALKLARRAESLSRNSNATVVLVVQATDIRLVAENVSLPVFSQHVDPVSFGSHTGSILPQAVREAGAIGTILNHAENKRDNPFIEKAVKCAHMAGLKVMLCAEDTERAKQLAAFKPDFIAVEPPELIGGEASISKAQPELITNSIKAVQRAAAIPLIVGAGIKDAEDIRKAIKLGSAGVFIASGIVKASSQEAALKELLAAFQPTIP